MSTSTIPQVVDEKHLLQLGRVAYEYLSSIGKECTVAELKQVLLNSSKQVVLEEPSQGQEDKKTERTRRLSKKSKIPREELILDKEGFVTTAKFTPISKKERKGNISREKLWQKINQDYKKYYKKHAETLKHHIRENGIPPAFRTRAWQYLAAGSDTSQDAKIRSQYEVCVAQRAPFEVEKQIRKDLRRTFPTHHMFRTPPGTRSLEDIHERPGEVIPMDELLADDMFTPGQVSLFNVLKAYAVFNPKLRYCQGMNGMCGVFLMYMTEGEAFWMMDKVLSSPKYWGLGDLWAPGFPLLERFKYVFQRCLKKHQPKMYKHLTKASEENFEGHPDPFSMLSGMFMPWWFQFMYSLFQPTLVMRIWDIFLLEGPKILFRVALGIFKLYEKKIFALDFGGLASFLCKEIYDLEIDVRAFIAMINADIKIPTAKFMKYIEEHKKLVESSNS